MNNFDIIDFVIPEEGAFISIENFCITKESTKEEYAYKLLNFLYRKSSIIQSYKTNWLLPATLSPIDELPLLDFEKKLLRMSPADFKKFSFFTKPVSPQQARDIWVEVKSF